MSGLPHAILQLSLRDGEQLQYRLELADELIAETAGPSLVELETLRSDWERVFSSSRFEDVQQLLRLADRFSRQVLPATLAERLKQWSSNHTEPVYLAVRCREPQLVRFPWELLPIAWRAANVQVVRLATSAPDTPERSAVSEPCSLLAVGWPDLPGIQLPGIERELTQLPRQLIAPQLRVSIQMGPTFAEFAKAYRQLKPTLLHLVPPGITRQNGADCLLMAGSRDENALEQASQIGGVPPGTELVPIEQVAELLREHAGLRLAVLNTCHGGQEAAGHLSTVCSVAAVGWIGFVPDDLAADFALYFHQRLLEGRPPAESVFLFLHRFQVDEETVQACLPVVWLPSTEAISDPLVVPPEVSEPQGTVYEVSSATPAVIGAAVTGPTTTGPTTTGPTTTGPATTGPATTGPATTGPAARRTARRSFTPVKNEPPIDFTDATQALHLDRPRFSGRISSDRSQLEVQIELEPALTISPALLKNGRPAIRRLSLLSNEPASGLRLEVLCDAGFGSSVFRRVQALRRGAQPIQDNIQFPVLFELSDRRLGRRRINFTARVSDESGILAEETRSALWMGHNEWMDREDTWPFIPSFVFPNSDAVRQIFDMAVVELRKIGTPKDNFVGYQRQSREKVDLQMRAVFQTLRDFPLDYINPPAAPVYFSTEQGMRPGGQLVRFPSEVLQYKRGTCHDLALLVASCAEHIGIYPLIVLCQGHTLCGYWTDPKAHESFWSEQLSTHASRAAEFGDDWLIRDARKLGALVENGSVTLVEATRLTRDDTFETACRRFRNTDTLLDARLQAAIDVWLSRRTIQPL